MKIQASVTIDAPLELVFRFFSDLSHLRFVSSKRRREWCCGPRFQLEEGQSYAVCVSQGNHQIQLNFENTRLSPESGFSNRFMSWPLRGGIQEMRLEEHAGKTTVEEVNRWDPPWFARGIVERHRLEQRKLFESKLQRASQFIEAAYARAGDAAFLSGVEAEAVQLGLQPVVSPDGVAL